MQIIALQLFGTGNIDSAQQTMPRHVRQTTHRSTLHRRRLSPTQFAPNEKVDPKQRVPFARTHNWIFYPDRQKLIISSPSYDNDGIVHDFIVVLLKFTHAFLKPY